MVYMDIVPDTYSNNRRCFLRIANNFNRYYLSEKNNFDVSCLAAIHYYQNKPRIIFRASDIKNELYTDIITIYNFFIKPVYNLN
jgi:hypothetical protein